MRDLQLAWRLLRRDHAAGELRLLLMALFIAVAGTTLIQCFADRLERGMSARAADVLGGDLVVTGAAPLPAAWRDEALARGLAVTGTQEFATVALHGDAMQLSSVKAVGEGYPLRGTVRTAQRPFVEGEPVHAGPAAGRVWIEARLLGALGVAPGETLDIGDATFTVEAVITAESDRGASFYSFSPRIMMNAADLEATGVVQPGSRVSWRLAVAGSREAVQDYRRWLDTRVTVHEKVQDTVSDRPELSGAMDRATSYLLLSGMMAVVLAGVAIALSVRRYSERHRDMVAMLRCLGVSQSRVVRLFAWQWLLLMVAGGLAGATAGYAAQTVLVSLLQGMMPIELPPAGVAPFLMGVLTGAVMLAGFALPPLLSLRSTPPLRVLRQDIDAPALPVAWVHALALAALTALVWTFTGDGALSVRVVAGSLVAICVFALLSLGLLRLAARWGRGGEGRSLALTFAVRRLTRDRAATLTQLLGFGMTFLAMTLLVLTRTDLIDTWSKQVPADAPNHFAINILPADVGPFSAWLDERKVPRAALYPMIRGRLVAINDKALQTNVSKEERTPGSVDRELNLTWSDALDADNRLVEGSWWDALPAPVQGEPVQVSVEAKLAQRLGLALNDHLQFSVGGIRVDAVITSLREVHWDSFRPNFYMMFRPGSLDHLPVTYMTSFHLESEQKPLLNDMTHSFRSVTVLEVDAMLRQVRDILTQVTLAIEFILLFALAAGLTVLWASVQASLPARTRETALMRTLGAGGALVRRSLVIEFLLLGALAGLLGVVGAEGLLAALYAGVFELPFAPNPVVIIAVPLLGALLVCTAGMAGVRQVAATPLAVVLREC